MTTTANPIVTWKTDPAHSSAEFKVKHTTRNPVLPGHNCCGNASAHYN
jgi:polyisoprenoid-binding protein YceI